MATNKQNYISNYNKENYKMYQFRIKKTNNEIIQKLESVSNRNEYLFNLLEEDINPSVLTIKQIKNRIKPVVEKYQIKEVYLFGSYARGEANNNSDVDIYCDKGNVQGLWDLTDLYDDFEKALNKKVDIVTIGSQIPEFFMNQLEEDKIRIC